MLRQVGQSIYTLVGGKSKTFLDYKFIHLRMRQRHLALQCTPPYLLRYRGVPKKEAQNARIIHAFTHVGRGFIIHRFCK